VWRSLVACLNGVQEVPGSNPGTPTGNQLVDTSYSPRVRSLRWTLATAAGFTLGGVALHSPGASANGASYLEWDVSAAVFGAILGTFVGVITALLQMLALGVRNWRLVAASVVAVAVAHALADGAPAAWGVGVVAALSGICAAVVLAWALRTRAWRWIIASAFAWWAGWMLGVAIAVWLRPSGGATPGAWATEHAVIAIILGLAWGSATSPDARRLLEETRLLRSVG
jgi:hypothetical protein